VAFTQHARERHPHIACRSVADFHTLDGIASWVTRELD
jgi:[acyl-carrier-protein] S-malonyltransferase